MPPSRDDFARWRDDRVTDWVIRAHLAAAETNRTAWTEASWNGGACSKEMLLELRTRADAYLAIAETGYEGFCDMLGETPDEE